MQPTQQFTPTPQPAPSVVSPIPAKKSRGWLKALLLLVLLAAAAGGVYYWQHGKVSSQGKQISALNSQVTSLNGQISSLKSQPSTTTTKAETTSQKLPNGKTISYPLTPANSTIVWWWLDASAGENAKGSVLELTSTKYIQFAKQVDSSILKKACDIDNSQISLGSTSLGPTTAYYTVDGSGNDNTYKTGDLRLHGQSISCIEAIGDSSISGSNKYTKTVSNLKTEVTQDFKNWAKSVTIN